MRDSRTGVAVVSRKTPSNHARCPRCTRLLGELSRPVEGWVWTTKCGACKAMLQVSNEGGTLHVTIAG